MSPSTSVRRRQVSTGGDWPDSLPSLLRRVYQARGAASLAEARPRLAQLLPPSMLGLEAAVALLADAIDSDRHILVVGDFDCDGATACATAVRGLRMLGARRVSHAVPNRQVHGYGLSPGLVGELAAMEPQLLVTVDHGIACHDGIQAAKARGWQVLVTDHHLPGETLPPADAIVNPNQPGCSFPSKSLAGVGVVFYVLLALRRHLRAAGRLPMPEPDLGQLLDLVAVGTVADLVPLDANNRALVAAGLRRLRSGQGCPGLTALVEVSGRDLSRLSSADIGYAVAPRLNAAGRLDDMAIGIECLLSDSIPRARELAGTLERINAERRAVQQQMTARAEQVLSTIALGREAAPVAACLFDPGWHPGVVGLVASRMKERLHRPVIAFAPAEPGGSSLRGSARSIPGLHVRDALAAVDARRPGLIERFGGHAMAAGLSLPAAHLDAFTDAFVDSVQGMVDPAMLMLEVPSDGELSPGELCHAMAVALREGGPWGQAFPEPQFDGVFQVRDWRVVGQRHLKLEVVTGGLPLNAIHFGGWSGNPPPSQVRLAYRLATDDYRGGDAIQLIVEHLEAA
ncbi:single-stranded-DNA-specific exonuclease RecJ [Lysobacter sp. GX 14042]|uniref:single-stranded-DNA-specific exonuclease RecJ n=1 Tax=Lysobacter sp. GX 14042 TaxID=2907155 RepID=UPI001F3F7E34|nr:single-stranded-DNA-specific exonuclease RecJ [Lysobacter sp. GX 14042]